MGRAGFPLLLSAALLVSACDGLEEIETGDVPDLRSAVRTPEPPARSDDSFDQERFYRRVETQLLARGLLRDDGGGPDVPFTDEMLTRSFLALAFSEEFSDTGGVVRATGRASALHRWVEPVQIETVFGATVDKVSADTDLALVSTYADRLSRITDHPVSTTDREGNFTLFVLHEQDIRTIGPSLKKRLPEISSTEIAFVETLPLETYCVVLTSDPGNDGEIDRAVAIVRAELPTALRTACYHEELAQGLGLANDSDFARPSVFKDDDEFGRLTDHDEHLLRLLYDSRLTPGMTETEAAPLVREIARALMAPRS